MWKERKCSRLEIASPCRVCCIYQGWPQLALALRDRIRAKNKVGSGDLIPERQNSNGNELEISATGFLPLNSYSTLHGLVEGRLYSNNAYEVGGATVAGVGGGYNRTLSSHYLFHSDLRFYFGSMDFGTDYSIKGLRATVGLKVVL